MGSLDDLKDAGFSDDEINGYAKDTRQTLATGGFNDQEINDYLGTAQPDNLAANKTLARTVVNAAVDNYREQAPPDQQGLSLGKIQTGISQANKAILDTAKEAHDQITDPANLYGAVEAWLNMTTGMVTGFPASLFGAVGGLYAKHSVGMDVDPAEMADTFAKAFTYAPRSARGQQLAGIAQYPLQKLAQGASWAGHRTTDASQYAGLSDETSAGIGAVTEQVLQFLPMMLMGELFHKAGGQVILNDDFKNVSRVVAGDGATAETRQAVENSLREIHDKTGIGPYTVAGEAAKDPAVHADLINTEVGVPKAFERYVEKPQVSDAIPGDDAPLPEVAQQVNESLQTQGSVRIPVADYLTHFAGGKVDEGIRENLKADPAGMTKAESDAFFQSHTNQIMEEAKALAESKQGDDAWNQSKQAIHDDMLRQMDEAAIHGTDVNKQYAKVRSEIFSVGAHRTGTTPEEFYQKWGAKIVAGDIADAKAAAYDKSSALNQGGDDGQGNAETAGRASGGQQPADLRTVAGESPVEGFWGGTKLRTRDKSKPLVVYRGQKSDLTPEHFKDEALGYSSGSAPSGRGVHFADVRSHAEHHAELNGGHVAKYYIDMRNPYVYKNSGPKAPRFDTAKEYTAWRNKLRDGTFDGKKYDGIVEIGKQPDGSGWNNVIAFDPHQVIPVPKEGKLFQNKESLNQEYSGREYSYMRNALGELSDAMPDIFREEKSKATDVHGALNDIIPGGVKFNKENKNHYIDQLGENAHYKQFQFPSVQKGEETYTESFPFGVYETKDGRVWADLSASKPGSGSRWVYTALGDYAHNTGKEFIGDPQSLSQDATIRRTFNMLASAIRHGTTEHLGASKEQIAGDEANGVPPLRWNEGDKDIDRFNALAHTFVETIDNNVPKLKDVYYDFDRKGFYERSGSDSGTPVEFTRTDFQALADTGTARAAKAGEATLRAASLLKSLLQVAKGDDGQRGRVLSRLFSGETLPGLERLFQESSKPDIEVRGYFDPIKRLIGFTKNADLSTLPHELGHEVFDIYTKIAKEPDCPPEIRADVDKLLAYVGVKGEGDKSALEVWHGKSLEQQRPAHEKIAEAFEKYFWEGKAPTLELQPVFARIKGWIADIYRHSIKNLPDLNPEVRGVFDRWLASEGAGVEKIQANSPEEVNAEARGGIGAVENAAQLPETKSGEAYVKNANKTSEPSAEDKDIEARFAEKLKDHESAVAEYSRIKGTWGGKFLNADLVRELCPDYLKNRFKASVIHQLASAFIRRIYAEKLATINKPKVLFTAGGPGAGKSTVIRNVPEMAKRTANADIVYDTTMSHYESSKEMIDQALDAGGTVRVAMVIREPVDALVNGALLRAALEEKEFGSARTMPVDYFVNSHLGAMKTVLRLAEEYKGNPEVTFNFIDNTHGKENVKEISLGEAKNFVFEEVEARVKEALEKEHKDGKISEKIYARFKFGSDEPRGTRKR